MIQTEPNPDDPGRSHSKLEQAGMKWSVVVVRDKDSLRWLDFDICASELTERVFGLTCTTRSERLWSHVTAPDLPAMTAFGNKAILGGEKAYRQKFRVVNNGRLFWLLEHVEIRPIDENSWNVSGITVETPSESSASEPHLTHADDVQQILNAADCLLWRANVFRKPGGIDAVWVLHIPPSNLYRRIFGCDPPLHPYQLWDVNMVPSLPEMSAKSNAAIIAGASKYEQEYLVLAGGKSRWMHEHVRITKVTEDEWSLTGILMDVTATHEATEALKKSDAQMQHILEAADCLIWHSVLEPDGSGDYAWTTFAADSALYRKLFGERDGKAEDSRLVLDWRKLKVPDLPVMIRRYKGALAKHQPGYEQEFEVVGDRFTYWLHEQVSITPLGNDRFEFVGVITDITHRRHTEEALASEREKLAVTLRAMAEGVITTDVNGYVQFINPAASILVGYEEGECVGVRITEICVLEHKDHARGTLAMPNLLIDSTLELPDQTVLVARSGVKRTVEGCNTPIHDHGSKVIGMVLVFRDITERERMEKELVRASRLESVGILAGGIAHDFNNILTAVIANLSLAKLDIQGDSDLATCVREAESATLRARDLTQQLLTFANGGEPVRSAVDFTSVVREVTEFALHGAKANCTFDLEDGLWPVDADKGQLGRVIQNLVINAVQAMPEGGTIRIVARNHAVIGIGRPAVDPGDYVHISIQDSGTGIKPKDLPHIFDPYFTTKQTGTGLGLAAVYSIIKKHRGLIDVDSELKKGTTFHIWMPALRASKALPEAASLSAIVPMKGKILFMDDEPSIRSMATMLMRRIGLEVVAVSDGREVIDKYNAALEDGTPFSLVIMDLTVPGGMGGREALSYLREIDAAVKVVVSSGYSSDPIMANHKEHGFCGMIAKPYDVGQFNRVIVETLGRGCLGATPSAN